MSDQFNKLVHFKKLLMGMEKDLGLDALGSFEKNVLLAMTDIEAQKGTIRTRDIKSHPFTTNVSRASLYRALKNLETNGKILKLENALGEYQTL